MVSKAAILDRIKGFSGVESDAALARFLGVSPATLSNWRSRNTIDYDLVFSKCVEANMDWLLTGNGPMLRTEADPTGMTVSPRTKDNQTHIAGAIRADGEGIPLIPLDAVAGFGTQNSMAIMEYDCDMYVVPEFRGAEFMIRVKGDSMTPRYSSGDLVACKKLPIDTFFQWNKVYVVGSEQGVLLKRVCPGSDSEHILLVSENEKYAPFELHKSDIFSISIVVGVVRAE